MKKISISILAALLAAVCVLSLTACGGGMQKTGTAYGLVHKTYVGQAIVTRDGDKVVSVKFEEMEGPASWAKRANIAEDKIEDIEFTTGGFAKSISIGSLSFKATDDAARNTPKYKQNDEGETFEEWVKKDENAKYYFEQMSEGNYRLLKADGSAGEMYFSTPKNDLKKGERWLKSKNGYWSGANYALGWQRNMYKMSDYLVRYGFASYTGNEVKGENGWTIDKVETGATLVDFHDYMGLAKRAFESAV